MFGLMMMVRMRSNHRSLSCSRTAQHVCLEMLREIPPADASSRHIDTQSGLIFRSLQMAGMSPQRRGAGDDPESNLYVKNQSGADKLVVSALVVCVASHGTGAKSCKTLSVATDFACN